MPKRSVKTKPKKMDHSVLLMWLVLVVFGLIMVASASSIKAHTEFVNAAGQSNDYWYLIQQFKWVVFSLVAVFFFSRLDYRRLRYFAFPALLIVIGLLAAVFLPIIGGRTILGAKRWLDFGFIGMQPSELTKISLVVYLATWLERKGKEVKDFKYGFIPFAAILGLIIFLLFMQKDLGTTIIICIIAVTIFFVSGANVFQLFFGGVIVIGLVVGLISVSTFRQARIKAWLNPGSDTKTTAYHVTQSRITIGSGGIWGVGYGHSLQKYNYIPHAPTDSIFAIIAEELGLVGSVALVALYLFFLYRIFIVAKSAPDPFGRLLSVGIGVWIGIQAFINIGGLMRIIPLTGVPLPFISYGGSSLLMSSIGVGMVLSVSREIEIRTKHENSHDGRGNGRSRRPSAGAA